MMRESIRVRRRREIPSNFLQDYFHLATPDRWVAPHRGALWGRGAFDFWPVDNGPIRWHWFRSPSTRRINPPSVKPPRIKFFLAFLPPHPLKKKSFKFFPRSHLDRCAPLFCAHWLASTWFFKVSIKVTPTQKNWGGSRPYLSPFAFVWFVSGFVILLKGRSLMLGHSFQSVGTFTSSSYIRFMGDIFPQKNICIFCLFKRASAVFIYHLLKSFIHNTKRL